jgi:putative flippase GtrA
MLGGRLPEPGAWPRAFPALAKLLLPLVSRGAKYALVAALGAGVNSAGLYLFKGVLGLPLVLASVLAIEIAIVHNFVWFRCWAWKDRFAGQRISFLRQLVAYNAVTGAIDLTGNISVLWALTHFFGMHYLIANVLGMIAPPIAKFWLNEKVFFRREGGADAESGARR